MARDINQVIITGRLGADPELRNSGSGKTIASIRVAASETWTDKNSNEKKERTEWVSVTVFRESTVRFLEHYVKKGDRVLVRGSYRTRMYEKDGVKHYPTEVVISDFDGDVLAFNNTGEGGGRPSSPDEYGSTRTRPESSGTSGAGTGGMDDDIPFSAEFR